MWDMTVSHSCEKWLCTHSCETWLFTHSQKGLFAHFRETWQRQIEQDGLLTIDVKNGSFTWETTHLLDMCLRSRSVCGSEWKLLATHRISTICWLIHMRYDYEIWHSHMIRDSDREVSAAAIARSQKFMQLQRYMTRHTRTKWIYMWDVTSPWAVWLRSRSISGSEGKIKIATICVPSVVYNRDMTQTYLEAAVATVYRSHDPFI